MSKTIKSLIASAIMLSFPIGVRSYSLLAQPACTPTTYTFTLNATEAELTQGDIAYLAATVRDVDGKFNGTIMVGGDRDLPIVQYLSRQNHKTITVTFCAH